MQSLALVNKKLDTKLKIRHKKRIDVQDSSTFLTSFKLVRQTMPIDNADEISRWACDVPDTASASGSLRNRLASVH